MCKNLIETFIADQVASSDPALYRTPLIGYASAQDDIYQQLKTAVSVDHLMPTDLLPGVRTVMAFFLSFKRDVLFDNRGGTVAAESWAAAYDATNRLISRICSGLADLLATKGIT